MPARAAGLTGVHVDEWADLEVQRKLEETSLKIAQIHMFKNAAPAQAAAAAAIAKKAMHLYLEERQNGGKKATMMAVRSDRMDGRPGPW